MIKIWLVDAMPHITEALERLMAKEKSVRPFVVVSDWVTGRYVQFAGSKGERLLFDVPRLRISERTDDALSVVAARACETFRRDFKLADHSLLMIEEGEQNACPS